MGAEMKKAYFKYMGRILVMHAARNLKHHRPCQWLAGAIPTSAAKKIQGCPIMDTPLSRPEKRRVSP